MGVFGLFGGGGVSIRAEKPDASNIAAEVKRDAEIEARKQAEEERKRSAAEARRQAEEERRKTAEEAAAKRAAELEARKQAEEERKKAVEARRLAEEDRRKSLADAAEKKRLAEEQRRKAQQKREEAQKVVNKASKGVTISLFGFGKKSNNTSDSLLVAVDSISPAPRGVPTISKWRQNRDGSITGTISGSNAFRDGDPVTTSPINGNAIGGTVVQTKSGSR